MLMNKEVLSIKTFKLFLIITFAVITVIITVLFNFKGEFKVEAARYVSNTIFQEINEKQVGYITKVYEKDGKRYLSFDRVKFLTGKEAVEAAKKDGKAIFENGFYYVLDDYYIVNEDKTIQDYVIDENASLNLLGFMVSSNGDDIINRKIDYEKFKAAINTKNYPKLCYIYLKNKAVIKVEGKYVP